MTFRPFPTFSKSVGLVACCLAAVAFTACAGAGDGGGGGGGSTGTGGSSASGGSPGQTGGSGPGAGGATGTGGALSTGGATGTGGAKGGATGTGGAKGGSPGTGGATGTGGSGSTVNCSATLPTSGGAMHTGDSQGTAAGQSWSLWMNGSGGSITTFGTPAFSASWGPSSGDFLARTGLSWPGTKTYDQLGTIAANFSETKSGTAGGYSYIGIYGWSQNPCVEWYIVDDAYNGLPFNPGNTTNKGTLTVDGGTYTLYLRSTTGTGGNRCGSSVTSWNQFYSMRQTARTCGTISISQHFAAWKAAGMALGNMLEASVLVEAGGGTGSIQFPVASVTAQ
jgi:endo-1,4-beta-xylanase